jgi:hypothetical protein
MSDMAGDEAGRKTERSAGNRAIEARGLGSTQKRCILDVVWGPAVTTCDSGERTPYEQRKDLIPTNRACDAGAIQSDTGRTIGLCLFIKKIFRSAQEFA